LASEVKSWALAFASDVKGLALTSETKAKYLTSEAKARGLTSEAKAKNCTTKARAKGLTSCTGHNSTHPNGQLAMVYRTFRTRKPKRTTYERSLNVYRLFYCKRLTSVVN